MWKFFFLLLFSVPAFAEGKVRKVEIAVDKVATVRTALGIATIIQVPDRPNSVVVGDQDAFKVEYLDQAITIKPLRPGSKSNLYIYTEWRRFNVELVTGAEATADYVVYLESPKTVKEEKSRICWMPFRNSLMSESLKLSVERVGKGPNGLLLVDFRLESTKSEEFKPEWLWITQEGKTRPIQNLVLSGLNVGPSSSVRGLIHVLLSEVDAGLPFRVEVRRKRVSYLTLPKAASWK